MIDRLYFYRSNSLDPYRNLAVEQCLLENVPEGSCILYLWQNENTVVIGRNQLAWKECRLDVMEAEGAHLARRLSGGGAVYHDLGNLNFTFLVPKADYCLDQQLQVICQGVRALGIPAERSGRNDLLAQGRKFSGNAFYSNGRQSYHHGTVMLSVDTNKLARYLAPSKAKLESKGVTSVRSRVANLREWVPELTVDELARTLESAFCQVYDLPLSPLPAGVLDSAQAEHLRQRYASREWLLGTRLPFTAEYQQRFPWGELQIQLLVEQGRICQVKAYSDAMDHLLCPRLEAALTGCDFSGPAMVRQIQTMLPQEAPQICAMLSGV